MAMEIKGTIVHELPLQTGMGKKGQWQKQDYVLDTGGQYPKKIAFSVWGDKIDKMNLSVGDEVTVSIELESREYNGKWYTEARGWKSETHRFAGPSRTAPRQEAQVASSQSSGPSDDLPF